MPYADLVVNRAIKCPVGVATIAMITTSWTN